MDHGYNFKKALYMRDTYIIIPDRPLQGIDIGVEKCIILQGRMNGETNLNRNNMAII